MDFNFSDRTLALKTRLATFMDDIVYPNESTYFDQLDRSPDRGSAVLAAIRAAA